MKHLKKLFSIFLIILMLAGISQSGDGYSTLSDSNPASTDIETIIDD